jgi:peptidoglycan lytic transglycosylase G
VTRNDGPDAPWPSARGRTARDEHLPEAQPIAPPQRPARVGRHGRPGAPDSRPAPEPQPGYAQPEYAQPGQPEYGQPGYSQPEYGQPGYTQSGYGQPGYTPSGYGPADYGQPNYGQPDYGQPGPAQPQNGGASHDPYGGLPDPYGPPDPYSPPDPYGPSSSNGSNGSSGLPGSNGRSGSNGSASGYGASSGYGQSGAFDRPTGYSDSGAYGPVDPYGPPAGHESPETYSQPGAYGAGSRPGAGRPDQNGSYGAASSYGSADAYGNGNGTGNGNGWPGQAPQRGAADPAAGYGAPSSYGSATPAQGAYGPGAGPAQEGSGRHGRAGGPAAGAARRPDAYGQDTPAYDTPAYETPSYGTAAHDTGGFGPDAAARIAAHGAPDPYGPPDPYRTPDGYGSGQFPRPGEHTGPLQRSGPQGWAGTPPDQSGPQYQAGAQLQQGAPYQTGPQDRTDSRPWTGPQDPWTAQPGHTGPQRAAGQPGHTGPQRAAGPSGGSGERPVLPGANGRADSIFTPARPLPSTPYDDDSLPGRDRFGSADPYDSRDSLPGLPAAAGPGGRNDPFRWQPPAEPGDSRSDEESTALWRNGRPVGRPAAPAGFPAADFPAAPDEVSPTGRIEADDEPLDDAPPWGAGAGSGPGPDGDQDSPDWADGERHRGFFQSFGEDENVDPPKRRRGRWVAPLISLVVIFGLIGASGAIFIHIYSAAHANYTGAGTGEVDFLVKPGDNATVLAPRLVKAGVIKATDPFVAAAKQSANSASLTPGTFRLHKKMNATLAWNLLVNPSSRIQTEVIVPPGLRAANLLKLLARESGKPLSQFQQAYADTAGLGLPSFANGNPEGYFYPATYDFPPGTTPTQMLHAMVAMFTTQTNSIGLAAAAAKAQFTVEQVITEASLLEAEVDPGDYGKAARTIDNRLNNKPNEIPLQLDSTVLYALHKTGFNLSKSELAVKSPYNTFLHTGLPPGPIDSPGLQAITAVLHPPHGNWIYFVTIDPKTGLTKFTNSAAQFNIWVKESDKNIANGT